MKTTVSRKMPMKAKPGSLRSAHIEYDTEGDGASVSYMHEPPAGGKSEAWAPGPAPHKKSFSTRMEAHHHMAQAAGVNAEMAEEAQEARAHGKGDSSAGMAGPGGESEGDDDEDQAEDRGDDSQPGAQASMSKAPAPKRKV
jgi:hypothetical protein